MRENKMIYMLNIGGTSGSGKTTLIENALGKDALVLGITTRDMRPGEVDGEFYKFVSIQEIFRMRQNGELLNFNEYNGHYYGYSKVDFDLKVEKYGVGIFITTVDTRDEFVQRFGCTTIFVKADYDDVKANIESRGDSAEEVRTRLLKFEEETARENEYDYVITNKRGQLDQTVEDFLSLLENLQQDQVSNLA